MDACTHAHLALSGSVCLHEFFACDDDAARRKIGTGNYFHNLVEFYPRVVDNRNRAVDNFAEIMRGNVRRKTHRYAVCAVNKQIRKSARQKHGFLHGVVKVPLPGYGILFEVFQNFHGKRIESRLGITHRRRAVAVNTSEVSVSVDKHLAHIEGLRHTNHSVVNRRVAVRMEFAEAFAYDTRRFLMRLIGRVAQFVHGV